MQIRMKGKCLEIEMEAIPLLFQDKSKQESHRRLKKSKILCLFYLFICLLIYFHFIFF